MNRLNAATRLEWTAATLLAVAITGGCKKQAIVPPPEWNPEAVATKALELHDTDRDGGIGGEELLKVPVLKAELSDFDTNGDKKISKEEVLARVQAYAKSRMGLRTGIHVRVYRGDKPISGATVSFVPEEFLGGIVKPAIGTTDSQGLATPVVAEIQPPGVQPGLYRVTISLKDANGKELVPAHYNVKTRLGLDVSHQADPANAAGILVDLNQ